MDCTISCRTEPPRRMPSRLVWLLALGCGAVFAACAGGSGSSGFEISAENAAIQRALDSNGCEVSGGLMICASGGETPAPSSTATSTATLPPPSDTPTPLQVEFTATPTLLHQDFTATPSTTNTPLPSIPTTTQPGTTATATPTTASPIPPESPTSTPTGTPISAQPSVDTNIDSSNTMPCQQVGPTAPCIFEFTFQPRGAPASAAYRVAVRTRNPDGAWLVMPVTDDSAAIAVDPSASGPRYQIAVLLFSQEPGFVPEQVDLLSDTGAEFAFVTPVLTAVRLP